jgi:hypothetical protein
MSLGKEGLEKEEAQEEETQEKELWPAGCLEMRCESEKSERKAQAAASSGIAVCCPSRKSCLEAANSELLKK